MIYVTENITSTNIGVLDSEGKKNLSSTKDFSEEPVHTFTVTIGGNIMSRGITFKNLLSMFFTRNAKKMQQATYQQRARLFGNRPDYMMSHFTLTITDELFEDWWEIFSLYELYLVSARAGRPIYPQTSDKIAVPYASIDKSTVSVDRGSLSLAKRKYTSEFDNLIKDYYDKKINIFTFLDKVSAMTDPLMEKWFVDYLNKVAPSEDDYVLHESGKTIEERYKDADSVNISRTKGGIFSSRMIEKYPEKSIHLWPVKNNEGEVRLWYKNTVSDKVTWLKNKRSNKKKFEGNFPS